MLFYISKSVANGILSGDVDCLDCVLTLLDSRKRGLLLLYSSDQTAKLIIEFFMQNGNIRQAELFRSIARRFREKKQMLEDLTKLFIISTKPKNGVDEKGRIVRVSPKVVNTSNILYPPIFLAEDLTDCQFYVNGIASNFTDVPTSMRELRLFERFEPGGGNNIHFSYTHHKALSRDLCLCIIDADRACPADGIGQTAKMVVKADQLKTVPFCSHILIDAYSAENLLPIDEIERQFSIGKTKAEISSFEVAKLLHGSLSWHYLPLKKGIKGKDVKGTSARAIFWNAQLKKIGIAVDCCDIDNCSCNFVPNISDKTLATAIKPSSSEWRKRLNFESNLAVKENYARISHEVRSWLCVGLPLRT